LVCDPNNNRIQVFDRDYNHLFNIILPEPMDVIYDNNNDRIIVPIE